MSQNMEITERGLKIDPYEILGTECGRCGCKTLKLWKVEYGCEYVGMFEAYLCDDCLRDLSEFMNVKNPDASPAVRR